MYNKHGAFYPQKKHRSPTQHNVKTAQIEYDFRKIHSNDKLNSRLKIRIAR